MIDRSRCSAQPLNTPPQRVDQEEREKKRGNTKRDTQQEEEMWKESKEEM
jgi:hypothetical protein